MLMSEWDLDLLARSGIGRHHFQDIRVFLLEVRPTLAFAHDPEFPDFEYKCGLCFLHLEMLWGSELCCR